MKHMYKMKGNKNMSKKEFVLKKNGKITIAEAQKETKIKKTYTGCGYSNTVITKVNIKT